MMQRIIITSTFILISFLSIGQIVHSDTAKKWYVPTHATIQYAGNFGFISAGGGYDFFIDRMSFDLMFGYLPESIGGITIFSLNLKTVYKPWGFKVFEDKLTIVPLNIGFLTMHAFGEQYTKFRKSGDYPRGYYWWPNSNRLGISFGQNFMYPIGADKTISTIELYWNVSADDLSLYSFAENEVVKIKHIYGFDFGFRVYF